jgi:hypothetical protein
MAILNDKEQGNNRIEAGREYVKRFSEKNIASEIMKVYESLNEIELKRK